MNSLDDALLKATLDDARCQQTSLGKSAVAQLTSLLKGTRSLFISIEIRKKKKKKVGDDTII